MKWLALMLATCAALLSACGSAVVELAPLPTVPPTVTPALAVSSPTHVALPLDESPYGDLTEWWYYTGHLTTTTAPARHYGFELVVFQVRRGDNPPAYEAHFAVTDDNSKTFHYAQRSSVGEQGGERHGFDLSVGGWTVSGANGNNSLQAEMHGYVIDLSAHATKPAVLHGGTGLINFGIFGRSYYYSRTRMAITGSIADHGVPYKVTGEAWMDHQWGNFIVASVGGWDWISIQLDNDVDVMFAFLRDARGQATESFGSYVLPSGSVVDLTNGQFTEKALGTWISPVTHIIYPSGWSVSIPSQGTQLILEPTVKDQELAFGARGRSSFLGYWEGEVKISGKDHHQSATGMGYVELTGYTASK
ncbi:MAG: hypothetical protein M1118_06140 [Chloroflexi bacterium]|nr:hypothetical protein [Chloroflexota bacterium]